MPEDVIQTIEKGARLHQINDDELSDISFDDEDEDEDESSARKTSHPQHLILTSFLTLFAISPFIIFNRPMFNIMRIHVFFFCSP
jgi:hypothetical protein